MLHGREILHTVKSTFFFLYVLGLPNSLNSAAVYICVTCTPLHPECFFQLQTTEHCKLLELYVYLNLSELPQFSL
jgi:hypothetical protein